MNFREILKFFLVHLLAASCIWPVLLLIKAWEFGICFAIIMGISFLYWITLRLKAYESLDTNNKVSYSRAFAYSAGIMILVYVIGSIILEIICLSQFIVSSPCINRNIDVGFPLVFISVSLISSAFFMIPLTRIRLS